MGLTNNSTGIKAVDSGLVIRKQTPNDKIIAVAGNPNVGKSTVFNSLTGLNQHTGNWSGKTVTNAQGYCTHGDMTYVLVDIPGTYSLMAHSAEEEVARDFICFGDSDAVIVVCDATCLERNLNLVLQTIEITDKVVVCVNLMDEAKKKNIKIDFEGISSKLGVPVVGTIARKKKSLSNLMQSVSELLNCENKKVPIKIEYNTTIEEAVDIVEPILKQKLNNKINSRWLSLKLLDYDETLIQSLNKYLSYDIFSDTEVKESLEQAVSYLTDNGFTKESLRDEIVSCLVRTAEDVCSDTMQFEEADYNARDRKIDKVLTSKWTGFPIMIAILLIVFWITITVANIPSEILAKGLFWIEDRLTDLFHYFDAPNWLHGMLVLGVYRVLAWVIAVMLPPMAIFFPLFTLLEDLGYLPRVAFNLDKYFKKCCACGKQALTMCMGFGCNAAGIIGCRIIDSPRERLIAMITNNFVPCNGRFPTLIAIISMFFVGVVVCPFNSLFSAFLLTCVIILGILMTFAVSKLLTITILKGVPSSFTLELPPYRKPQLGRVIVRSIFDRTLFVLSRAIVVAAPAGLIIWLMANISVGDLTLLAHCSGFLDPFAKLLGMDGAILLAFILGFPANEIVVPIIIMTYMSTGSILELDSLASLKQLLVDNGWTWITAVCVMLFSLMHWPCSTTCLTIKKETQSLKWTAVSFVIPTVIGLIVCFVFANIAKLFL
ncbi:MAG: ferrous iron transport protein B [Clostridiales bacterium GWF2_38_85]|nr:MAG: ferrous iron transport protein B [Clostridiales bacterium GWF2_38_85]HBL84443.1 ferrous iron transport protein B [Clostridiales bacterium]